MAQEFCSPERREKGRIPMVCNPFCNAAGGQKDKPDGAVISERGLSGTRFNCRRETASAPVIAFRTGRGPALADEIRSKQVPLILSFSPRGEGTPESPGADVRVRGACAGFLLRLPWAAVAIQKRALRLRLNCSRGYRPAASHPLMATKIFRRHGIALRPVLIDDLNRARL